MDKDPASRPLIGEVCEHDKGAESVGAAPSMKRARLRAVALRVFGEMVDEGNTFAYSVLLQPLQPGQIGLFQAFGVSRLYVCIRGFPLT